MNSNYREECSRRMKIIWSKRSEKERRAIGRKSSLTQWGRELTSEHLANLRASNCGPKTEAHRKHLSESLKGRSGKSPNPRIEAERVKKISLTQQGRIPKNCRIRGNFWYKGPKGRINMRSTWEVKYANYLDKKKLNWQYEPRWFNVGKGDYIGISYTPDFYVPSFKSYVEIKGYYGDKIKNKIRKFRKLYPKERLVLLLGEELLAMGVLDSLGYVKKAA